MKHYRIIKDKVESNPFSDIEDNSITNIFSYMLGIFKIKIYTEYRGENAGYKCFVYIYIFGKRVLHWFYRDEYARDFYLKNKTLSCFNINEKDLK